MKNPWLDIDVRLEQYMDEQKIKKDIRARDKLVAEILELAQGKDTKTTLEIFNNALTLRNRAMVICG